MADELKVTGRKLDQPIRGDTYVTFQGTAVDSKELDAGNSDTYTPSDGVNYVDLYATAALWFRISTAGSDAAVGGNGSEWLAQGERINRTILPKQIIKCVVDS